MKTILFQGDSITDAGRSYEEDMNVGRGYAFLTKAALGFENPGEYNFYNRGISGNRIVDVYARIKADIINLKPDYMSILIGVNDVWHEIARENGVDNDKFFKIYSMLIEEVKEALPNIKIMILEPFTLLGSANEETYESTFRPEVLKRADSSREIAEKYNLPFIPLQKLLDDALALAPADYWLYDGVHPTPAGHELIKREWLKCFNSIK